MLKSVKPQVRQTQGVPRAVFNRSAPHRPRWTFLSGPPAFADQGLSTAKDPGHRRRPV